MDQLALTQHPPLTKACADCGTTKPLDEFYAKPDRGGHDGTCKVCRRDERKNRYRERVVPPGAVKSVARETPNMAPSPVEAPVVAEDFERARRLFEALRRWRDEARARGQINW